MPFAVQAVITKFPDAIRKDPNKALHPKAIAAGSQPLPKNTNDAKKEAEMTSKMSDTERYQYNEIKKLKEEIKKSNNNK